MTYIVKTTETFEREFKKKKIKRDNLEIIISKLEKYPEIYGKPLRGHLHGIWQIRMGKFRVWYEINEENKEVILKAVFHKKEAEKFY
jgi:mRNA interferase RelE/StbE